MGFFIFLLFFACLRLRFPDVELNPGPGRPAPKRCRLLCSNIRGLSGNLADLTVASAQYDVMLLSETLVSDRRHLSELLIPGFGRPVLLYRDGSGLPRSRGMAAYVRDGFGAYRQNEFECGCCEMLVVRVCGSRQNFYVFSLYRNPDLDDKIFDCLLLSMAAVQAKDARACFLFAGDLNVHHREWLGSATTNRHGISALDFSTVSGCDQLVVGPTHIRGGTLDLLLTDVPDLVQVSVVAPIGHSDHSSLSAVILTAQPTPNLCISRRVFMKHQVNWDAVRSAVQGFPWHLIYRSDEPVEQLNVHLSEVVERYVPTRVIRLRNSDKVWFNDDCRLAFDRKQEAYRHWTRERSVPNWERLKTCQRLANEVYETAERQFRDDCKDVLSNAQSSHKWWSTLKSAVFGTNSSLPPLIGDGGGIVCEPGAKAALLADHFDSKQAKDGITLPLTCHPSSTFSTFAFRSSEVKKLLLELDSYGGNDPAGMFPLFYKEIADVLAPRLSVVFRRLIRSGSFPLCWRQANVTPVPKGPLSSDVNKYRPISITPVLSKVFERLVSVRLGRFMELYKVYPATQFAYRKGLGACDALLCVSHKLQAALDRGMEARLVQIDFSAAFDTVNHLGIIHKLRSIGVGGSVLSVISQFLSSRTQYVLVDGVRSHLVDVVSGVPQGSVLGPILFNLYTSDLFSILENEMVGYADDSTLIAVIPSPDARLRVAQSLDRDLGSVSDWCSMWGMRLNAGKTKTMIVSRSRTLNPLSPALNVGGVVLKNLSVLEILGVTFDAKMTFEVHLRSVSRSVSQRIGILRKSYSIFRDPAMLGTCFFSFLLPVLEYCSAVWCSAADSHLRLLDRTVASACFHIGGVLACDLAHRRSVAVLCMLYKIWSNELHPLYAELPPALVPVRTTRAAVSAHAHSLVVPRSRTVQYSRSFIPLSVSLWNSLVDSVFDGVGLGGFKNRANSLLLA